MPVPLICATTMSGKPRQQNSSKPALITSLVDENETRADGVVDQVGASKSSTGGGPNQQSLESIVDMKPHTGTVREEAKRETDQAIQMRKRKRLKVSIIFDFRA